jgi:hypothetical protein
LIPFYPIYLQKPKKVTPFFEKNLKKFSKALWAKVSGGGFFLGGESFISGY